MRSTPDQLSDQEWLAELSLFEHLRLATFFVDYNMKVRHGDRVDARSTDLWNYEETTKKNDPQERF